MKKIKAVLFDMDGVLTDSETVGVAMLRKAIQKQDIELNEELLSKVMGATFASSRPIYQHYHPTLDLEKLQSDFLDLMCEEAKAGRMPLKPDVVSCLEYLKEKGIPMAVASSSVRSTIDVFLGETGILHYFSAFVSGDMVTNSKPAPEIFELAAKKFNINIADCLVVEDSINGIKAGRASGATVLMVPDTIPFTENLAEYVDYVGETIEKLKEIVQ